jgi:Tfp pilus assembly protein FimT
MKMNLYLQSKNKRNNKGFTVLELMIVIGIMVMMLVLTVPNFKSFDRSQVLEAEADKLFSILRQAQIWALTGQTVGATRYNFGAYFLKCASAPGCNYVFFKDALGGDKTYDAGEAYGLGSITISKGVYVSNIKKGSDAGRTSLNIIFEVPTGKVYFDGVAAAGTTVEITLTSSLSGRSRIISVNGDSGQINMQ